MIGKHRCAVCPYISKRREKLLEHIRHKHIDLDIEMAIGDIEYEANAQFVDPSPFTFDSIRGFK